jgi:U3 small nucleolar RNA-associated protein 5
VLQALSAALVAPTETPNDARAAPTTESVATLLEQALQSGDDTMLEECLAVSDALVVAATVERLAPPRVLPLLMRLADRVERRPSRGLTLGVWLRAIFMRHASYLMSVPNLHVKLAGLYQILDSRTAVFPKLLSLNGRLELALAQIASQQDHHDGHLLPPATYDEEIDEVDGAEA